MNRRTAETRLLILASNPLKTDRLRLDEEVREIQEGLERGSRPVSLRQQWATRVVDIRRSLLRFRPHIVHFCGHGSGEKGIILVGSQGEPRQVDAPALSALFSLFSDTLECVVLNSCYSVVQAEAISQHIPYVVGMRSQIADAAALEFAVAFYDAIAAEREVPFAFELALTALQIEDLSSQHIPVLHMRDPTGSGQPGEGPDPLFTDPPESPTPKTDWDGAPEVPSFYGRAKEMETVKQWIRRDECKLVLLLGLGGIGKTGLSVFLGRELLEVSESTQRNLEKAAGEFECVLWRTLINAPSYSEFLDDLLGAIFPSRDLGQLDSAEQKTHALLEVFRHSRVLLIVDNYETILAGSGGPGHYRSGYEDFGGLLAALSEQPHMGCLILTSREMPREVARREGRGKSVRTLRLGGLGVRSGIRIFESIGSFEADDHDWEKLVNLYDGNPLALELAAHHILDVYLGDVGSFLEMQRPVFADLDNLLDWHLNRLTRKELEVMYWLAINREPMSVRELSEDLLSDRSKTDLPSTLQSLQRRIPLNRPSRGFTLQPVLLEFMTHKLVRRVGEEIELTVPELAERAAARMVEEMGSELAEGRIELFNTLTLQKALAKRFVRESQRRLILEPIEKRLEEHVGGSANLRHFLLELLERIRATGRGSLGYAAGNLLDLLVDLGVDISGWDFSHLAVWQADLRRALLNDTVFAACDFRRTCFRETFGNILRVTVDRAGRLIAAGDTHNEVRIWNVAEGQLVQVLRGHVDWIWGVAFSPDSERLASGSNDGTVRLWEVATGEALYVLKGHNGRVRDVVFHPGLPILASAGDDGVLLVWDLTSQEPRQRIKAHDSRIWRVAYSPRGRRLATAGEDGLVKIWETEKGSLIRALEGHGAEVRDLEFTSDGACLLSASEDGTVRLWRLSDGSCVKTLEDPGGRVWSAALSPDVDEVASASFDHSLRLWDLSSGECRTTLSGHSDFVRTVRFSPAGGFVVSGSEDRSVRVWDAYDGKPIHVFRGFSNGVWSLATTRKDRNVLSGGDDAYLRRWNLREGSLEKTVAGHHSRIWSICLDEDFGLVATAGADHTIRVWTYPDLECLEVLRGHGGLVRDLAFLPGQSVLLTVSEDRTVKVWEIETWECSATLADGEDWLSAIAVTRDGRTFATGGEDGIVRIWDYEQAKCTGRLRGHEANISSLSFHEGHGLLYSGSDDGTVRRWEYATGTLRGELEGHGAPVTAVAVMKGGSGIVLSGTTKGEVHAIDGDTCERVSVLEAHSGALRVLCPANDGSHFLSAGDEGVVKQWSLEELSLTKSLRVPRPYEGMMITGATGLSPAQQEALKALGAVSEATGI